MADEAVRDYLVKQGVDPNTIGYEGGKVTVGGMPLDISGLSISDGRSYADPNAINTALTGMYNTLDDSVRNATGSTNTTTPPVTNPSPVVTQTTVTNPAPVTTQTTVTNPTAGNPVLGKTSIGGAIDQINNGVNPVTQTPIQPTQPTQPVQPVQTQPVQPQPAAVTSAPVGVRDYLISLGVDPSLIGYNSGINGQLGQVTINGQPLNIAGLNIVDSRSYATPEQIQAGINALYPQGNLPITVQNDNKIIEKGQESLDQALKAFNETIKTIQDTPFNDQYATEKKALYEQLNRPFDYNPETDLAMKQAANLARKNVLATMNARGILNSTITEEGLKDVETTLIPQYRKLAFDEYNQQLSNIMQKLSVLQGFTEFDYQKYKDWVSQNLDLAGTNLDLAKTNLDTMYKEIERKNVVDQKKIEERKIAIEEAVNRTNLNGYVSNNDSIILGVKPGTLSETAQQRAWELKQYQEKQKLDLEYQQKMAAIEHQYTMEEITSRQEESQNQKDPTSSALAKATVNQQAMYNGYMQIYYGTPNNEYYNNPDRVLQNLLGNPEIAQDVGNDLYKAMIKQAESAASKISTVKPQDTSKADLSTKIAAITSELDKLPAEEAYNDLLNYPSDYISDLGSTTEYNRLLSLYKNKAGIE